MNSKFIIVAYVPSEFQDKFATEYYRNMQPKEPLIPHPIPDRPWEKVGVDIFSLDGKDYLIVVDYYSKYPEVGILKGKTAISVMDQLKEVFARHGIPEIVMADNMPSSSIVIKKFAAEWNFQLVTSSPNYAQSNGQAERAIQTVKKLLKKAHEGGTDAHIGLLQYRASPITGSTFSPAQLLMSRALRTKLPAPKSLLMPQAVNGQKQLKNLQKKQKMYYDRGARSLPELQPGETVRIRHQGQWILGQVDNKHDAPRSYIVTTESGGKLRRNRRHLIATEESPPVISVQTDEPIEVNENNQEPTEAPSVHPTDSTMTEYRTRSGRISKSPVRFADL